MLSNRAPVCKRTLNRNDLIIKFRIANIITTNTALESRSKLFLLFTITPPFWVYYSTFFGAFQYQTGKKRENPFARSATSLMRSITSLRSTSFAAGNIVHLCPQADNDVLASLEMMLTFGQMMLCPTDTNEKILKAMLSGFFGGVLTKKMPTIFMHFPFFKSANSNIQQNQSSFFSSLHPNHRGMQESLWAVQYDRGHRNYPQNDDLG